MAPPTTSFIVTCHNLGAYLDEAVDSILRQTVRDFEVVVVNDGSSDAQTCRRLAAFSREGVRVIHSERRGLPGARNLGARETCGKYLCLLDADDLLEPVYLERSLAVMQQQPGLAFASHWWRAFGDEQFEGVPTDCGFPALLHANTVNGAALLRRDVFDAVGGFDESLVDGCEDWEFWIRVVARGYTGVIIPEFLFQYRRRAGSMSRAMHAVPGMAALYRAIIAKHPEPFAAHAETLLRWRDQGIATQMRHVADLELEWASVLNSQVQWTRDNQRHADWHRTLEMNLELRRSMSWRITAPLRTVGRWFGW